MSAFLLRGLYAFRVVQKTAFHFNFAITMLSPPASNIVSLGLYASRRLRADIPVLSAALVSALYALVTLEDHTFTAALAVIVIVLCALVSFLFTFWSVSWKAFIQCCEVRSVAFCV